MELPRQTDTLEGFEEWDPDSQLPAKEGPRPGAFVSIRKGGTFGFNWNARKMMGDPHYLELLFDPQRRRIGFRKVGEDHPRAKKLGGAEWTGHGSVGALKFCEYYDVPIAETTRYTPRLIDGVLVVDLQRTEVTTVELGLEIEERDLGGGWVEAYYLDLGTLRAMAVQPGIDAERRRLWELVARGLEYVPREAQRLAGPAYKTGGFVFLRPRRAADANVLAVRAVSKVLEELEPGWIAAVEDARRLADSPAVLAAWCEVPIEAVLAITGDWRTRL